MKTTADKPLYLRWRERSIDLAEKTLVMGILNVTPDSFSDGGRYMDIQEALRRAREMIDQGVDILDIGGESTRPGSDEVDAEEECRRVIPVIRAIRAMGQIPISIDTRKAVVAREALRVGADMINDVSALRYDPEMAGLVAEAGVPVVLMHMRGTPATMQQNPFYDDVIEEILAFLEERVSWAVSVGIPREHCIVDPGIGFGKTVDHNLEILDHFEVFHRLGCPILIGVSRKSFIGAVLGREISERLWGTAAAVAVCVYKGAHILRVHDVAEMRDVCRMVDAIRGKGRRISA